MSRILHYFLSVFIISFLHTSLYSQQEVPGANYESIDSLYIDEVESKQGRAKVMHAEPLYVDLIRDLGARKGEREWNVGLGLTDKRRYDEYIALIEYEWAPIDRLGLEIELPFSFYYRNEEGGDVPQSRLNSLKLASQWSFFVSEKYKTSMALGYLHEFEIVPFQQYGSEPFYDGNIYNPFFVAAKRWGQNYHTLIYAGPQFIQNYSQSNYTNWQINTNFHYMIPGTRNFIGVEFNKDFSGGDFDMIIRPQMRLEVRDDLMIGIVTGIPFKRENERFSSFIRIIYEPKH